MKFTDTVPLPKDWLGLYKESQTKMRFGQWFIAEYAVEGTWPELFYEEDTEKAFTMLHKHLWSI